MGVDFAWGGVKDGRFACTALGVFMPPLGCWGLGPEKPWPHGTLKM